MKKKLSLLLLILTVLVVALTGCGKSEEKKEDKEQKTAAADAKKLSICFVVTGQLGDKSFNDSANAGVSLIAKNLGYETKVIEIGRDQTKWQPTFEDLAESGKYSIIITNGSNAGELIQKVAPNYPNQKFILFDTKLEKNIPNIYAISYEQNEGSYLAGVLAAMVTNSNMPGTNPDKKKGFIGGSEHPIITDFLVGYIEGAKSVDKDIKVYVSYIGSWDDTAKGKETAIAQYNQGVDIVFPAAEQAGLGCIDAAIEQHKYIIGVDSDQAMLFDGVNNNKANVILSSVLKEVGNSLVRAVELEQKGELKWGTFESLGIKENGVGLADNKYYQKNVSEEIRNAVIKAKEDVVSGKTTVTSALEVEESVSKKIIDSVAP